MLKNIVIGVDGSDCAAEALRWGVEEASVHDTKATALLAWTYLRQYHEDPRDEGFLPGYHAESARESLDSYVRAALGDEEAVERKVVCDLPTNALLDEAEHADLLVVGSRGTGGFEGLLLGSVADRVAERATCPVAVVRGPSVPDGKVVVGIDGSARSTAALTWAAAEARARNAELEIVHAWRYPVLLPGGWMPAMPTHDEARKAAEELVANALQDPAVSGLKVASHLAETGAARSLLERAEGAGLLIVGTRGVGRVSGWLLGSVSRQVLHHATCSVVVV